MAGFAELGVHHWQHLKVHNAAFGWRIALFQEAQEGKRIALVDQEKRIDGLAAALEESGEQREETTVAEANRQEDSISLTDYSGCS